jgi:Na+-translocating ferredoxin:NAD+ oxidoreductase RnfC subunit
VNIKKQTKTPRQYQDTHCVSCGTDFAAPVKIRGKGIIGGGKCPDCLRLERPASAKQCPVCKKPFKTQAGHVRETCSRTCQKVHTLKKRSPQSIAMVQYAATQEGILRAQAEAEQKEAQAKAQAEKDRMEAEARALRELQEERRRMEAAEAEAAQDAYKNAEGTVLEKLAAVSKTVRKRREKMATAQNKKPERTGAPVAV